MTKKLNKKFIDCFKDSDTPKSLEEDRKAEKIAMNMVQKTLNNIR